MKSVWEIKKLGDVCFFENGDRGENYPSKSVQTDYGIPFINAGHLKDQTVDFSCMNYISRERFDLLGNGKVKPDDILFCLRGSLGKFACVRGLTEAAIASSLIIIRPREMLLNNFAMAYLQSYICQDMIEQFKNGAAQPNLSAGSLKKFIIPIPPIQEQRRIVAILDEAFAGISAAKESAEKNLKNISEIFKSWFNAVSSPSEQESWTKKTVSELVAPQKGAIRTGPFGSQLLHTEFVDKGIAVLGIDNAVENEFSWGKKRFITEEKYQQMKRYKVNPDDVLITIMGTCGRCAVVPEDIQTAINTKHLCCITLNKKKCLPWYLHTYFLYHPLAQDFLSKHAKGAIMAGLNMGIIKELPVLLPPIEKQNEIVEKFHSFKEESQRLKSLYQQKLANLEELKKSILQKAFSGAL